MANPEQNYRHIEDADSDKECPVCGNPVSNEACQACRTTHRAELYRKNLVSSPSVSKEDPPNSIHRLRRRDKLSAQGVAELDPKQSLANLKKRVADSVREHRRNTPLAQRWEHLTPEQRQARFRESRDKQDEKKSS